jgi:hypothetical protein
MPATISAGRAKSMLLYVGQKPDAGHDNNSSSSSSIMCEDMLIDVTSAAISASRARSMICKRAHAFEK